MRRAGPILILIIGVFALVINFFPGLMVPDTGASDGSWRAVVTKLGLDLSGGLRVEYQAQSVDGKTPTLGDMSVIKDIVERRVNTTGVSEPLVTTQGSDRVVVELPGVTDPEAVRKLVGQTGQLDFVPLGSTTATEGQVLDLKQYPPLFGGDQVASALDLVVHLSRLRDGSRRVTQITEVVGTEGDLVTLSDVFVFDYSGGIDEDGRSQGVLAPTGLRPNFTERLADVGIELPARILGVNAPVLQAPGVRR
jgi:hypothetical protein